MMSYEGQQNAASQGIKQRSRIENDTKLILEAVERLQSIENRIFTHARSLGYFQDTPSSPVATKPTPVSLTLADAIADLDRAVNSCSGALNVFD
jgi:hypothetical protein